MFIAQQSVFIFFEFLDPPPTPKGVRSIYNMVLMYFNLKKTCRIQTCLWAIGLVLYCVFARSQIIPDSWTPDETVRPRFSVIQGIWKYFLRLRRPVNTYHMILHGRNYSVQQLLPKPGDYRVHIGVLHIFLPSDWWGCLFEYMRNWAMGSAQPLQPIFLLLSVIDSLI